MTIFKIYHYNHQGSVALVTNMSGRIRQHLQYLPYGGTFVDHRPNSYASTYTFSAKEKDSESGYTYFGARYYSDGIMQWLSVDPMSDKYPSMSPYMYCAGNPIMYKDPDGRKVVIEGEAKKQYFKQVKEGAKSLGVSVKMDRTGTLSAKYNNKGSISEDAGKFIDAVNCENVTVHINATTSDYVGGKPFVGGTFLGNKVNGETALAYQVVNPKDLQKMDDYYGTPGRTSLHEATEAHQGALISISNGISSGDATMPSSVYQQAHDAAISQPFEKLDKYNFDINGNQSERTGLPPISVGWYFNNTTKKIKEVDY